MNKKPPQTKTTASSSPSRAEQMTCVFCKDDRPFDFLEVWSDVLSKLASKWWAPGYGWHFPDFSEPFGSVVSMVFFWVKHGNLSTTKVWKIWCKINESMGFFCFSGFFWVLKWRELFWRCIPGEMCHCFSELKPPTSNKTKWWWMGF